MRQTRGVATAELTDSELIAAHVSGDTQAFSELVRRHQRYLWRVAKRTCYSAEDAADALQEALLSAHRMAESFRADAAVRSWLHRIVVNACLDRMRRNRVRATVPLEPAVADHVAVFEDAIEMNDVAFDVEEALRLLPEDQRQAIVAVDIEGYSVTDAAELLGVPTGTIKSRCSRGRLKLAKNLQHLQRRGNQADTQRVKT
ncbi:RNA polymerase sigma factor SigM [Hoyosella rhizosphaerae]|uniref:RNA polymerase sigma factor SigM n=1 Tax=Hoyosella rhizosphaerae TaxID=1755582 RepID=UPI00166C1503|nr:RNA polymerase sigma factor SigM [Hoyosella rhizosphaerae]MBN4927494.1 RNA polymerase sigma factor SigM [Hoyosella rhizosphaerae]